MRKAILINLGVIILLFAMVFLWSIPKISFTKKAAQSEGKALLAAIYHAQNAHFAEYKTYSPDLASAGFLPQGKLKYVAGFSENCRKKDETLNTLQYSDKLYFPNTSYKKMSHVLSAEKLVEVKEVFNKLPCAKDFPESWEAYAVGYIGGENLDIWKINDQKIMLSVQDGVPKIITHKLKYQLVAVGLALSGVMALVCFYISRKRILAKFPNIKETALKYIAGFFIALAILIILFYIFFHLPTILARLN